MRKLPLFTHIKTKSLCRQCENTFSYSAKAYARTKGVLHPREVCDKCQRINNNARAKKNKLKYVNKGKRLFFTYELSQARILGRLNKIL